MISILSWERNGQTLILIGNLNRDTLKFFWQKRNQLLKNIKIINISKLSYIDSAGLAMFIRLKSEQKIENKLIFKGNNKRFKMLIKLYKIFNFIKFN
ncbi:MAG: lipid asymmetry maintenance protein MlaB, partial [Arsenophonus sp. ER-LPS3-MAG3]